MLSLTIDKIRHLNGCLIVITPKNAWVVVRRKSFFQYPS